MIRKVSLALMLLVLLPGVLATVSSDDWDGDGVDNDDDRFPMDYSRTGVITGGTENIDDIPPLNFDGGAYNREFYNIALVDGDKSWMDYSRILKHITNDQYSNNIYQLSSTSPTFSSSTGLLQSNYQTKISHSTSNVIHLSSSANKFLDNDRTDISLFNTNSYFTTHYPDLVSTNSQVDFLFDYIENPDGFIHEHLFHILDTDFADTNDDGILDMIILAKYGPTWTNTNLEAGQRLINIYEGTGSSTDLFNDEKPIIFAVPREIQEFTFITPTAFIYHTADNHIKKYNLASDLANADYYENDGDEFINLTTSGWPASSTALGDNIIKDVSRDYILTAANNYVRVYNHNLQYLYNIKVHNTKGVRDAKFGFINDDDHIDIITAEYYEDNPENFKIWYNKKTDSQDQDSFPTHSEINVYSGTQKSVGGCPSSMTDDESRVDFFKVADIDRDGDEDLLVVRSEEGRHGNCNWNPAAQAVLLLNPGTAPPSSLPPSPPPSDTDNDGVNDAQDNCSDTPSGESVDATGCSESQIPERGVLLSSTTHRIGDLVSGVLINLQKAAKTIYWFDGIQETDYEIYDDAPNQRTLCRATATSYCTIDSATYTSLAFGEECSCATPEDEEIPIPFKIYNEHVFKSSQFVKVYRSIAECPESICTIQSFVIYEDDTNDSFNASFLLLPENTALEDINTNNNPYGPYSQECTSGGQQILNTNWCCVAGYVPNPDLTDISLTGEDINACQPYQNKPPTASFTASSTNISIGDIVTFNASSSQDIDGVITQYVWNFGDASAQKTGETVMHRYSSACTQTPCKVT